MTFTLTIDCDNAAFEEAGIEPELARILRELARRLAQDASDRQRGGTVRDINGNTVGTWEITQ